LQRLYKLLKKNIAIFSIILTVFLLVACLFGLPKIFYKPIFVIIFVIATTAVFVYGIGIGYHLRLFLRKHIKDKKKQKLLDGILLVAAYLGMVFIASTILWYSPTHCYLVHYNHEPSQYRCLSGFYKDADFETRINFCAEFESLDAKESCLIDTAIDFNKIEMCNNLNKRSWCIIKFAIYKRMPEACEKLESSRAVKNCYLQYEQKVK